MEQAQAVTSAAGGQSDSTVGLAGVSVGDTVRITNHEDNAGRIAGVCEQAVIAADEHSIAVAGTGGPWWFYRTGESYVGNATAEPANLNSTTPR